MQNVLIFDEAILKVKKGEIFTCFVLNTILHTNLLKVILGFFEIYPMTTQNKWGGEKLKIYMPN